MSNERRNRTGFVLGLLLLLTLSVATILPVPSSAGPSLDWPLIKMHVPEAWTSTHGSASTKIAVIDSGIDPTITDFALRVGGAADCSGQTAQCVDIAPNTMRDTAGHGTAVAGLIFARGQNLAGVYGLAWNAQIFPVKIRLTGADAEGSIANAVLWAVAQHVQIINISLGDYGPPGPYLTEWINAVKVALTASPPILVVAAAGNAFNERFVQPAATPGVLSVAGTNTKDQITAGFDSKGKRTGGSTYGPWVDVAAPGQSIALLNSHLVVPADRLRFYTYLHESSDGSSLAAPFVAGLAGLLWDYCPNAVDVKRLIETSTDPIDPTNGTISHGRVNAYKAVQAAQRQCSTPEVGQDDSRSVEANPALPDQVRQTPSATTTPPSVIGPPATLPLPPTLPRVPVTAPGETPPPPTLAHPVVTETKVPTVAPPGGTAPPS